MSSKRSLVVIVAISLVVASCGLHLGETSPKAAPVSYSGKGYGCIGQIPQHVEMYFNDRLSEDQITEFVTCIQKSFTSFAQLTSGREQSTYSADELRNFLQSYFLRSRPITDRFLAEFMALKVAVLGGSSDRLSRVELYAAIDWLEDIRVQAIRLKPHMRMLNHRLAMEQDPRGIGPRLNGAGEALNQAIGVFAQRLQGSKQDYSLEHLKGFLTEFRAFVGWEDHFADSRTVDQWKNLIQIFKEVTVSPNHPEVIRANEWAPLLKSMTSWYLTLLQFDLGIKGKGVMHGIGLQNLIYLAQQVFDQADEAIKRQIPENPNLPRYTVSFGQIDRMIESLSELGWLPKYVRVSSLQQLTRVLVDRIFGTATTPPNERSRLGGLGLTSLTLANMRTEFYRWAYIQQDLEDQFANEAAQMNDDGVPSLQTNPHIGKDLRMLIDRKVFGAEWNEFIKIKILMRPLYHENSDRVVVAPAANLDYLKIRHGFTDLSNLNLVRSLTALIFRGYAGDVSSRWLWSAGLERSEMQQFYDDFHDFGIDLGVLDPRSMRTGDRVFVEANLFTYASDGVDFDKDGVGRQMSFLEGIQFFSFLYSGGQVGLDLYESLAGIHSTDDGYVVVNCEKGPPDIFAESTLNRACVRANLGRILMHNVSNLPGLQLFLASLSEPQILEYVDTILQTAGTKKSNPKWVERAELSSIGVISQYVEAVMTRYDKNGDGVLVNAEIEDAIPVFSGFIKYFAKTRRNWDLWDVAARGFFYYILENKKIPTTDFEMSSALTNILGVPTVNLDRRQLAQVFRVIIQSIVNPEPPEVKKRPVQKCTGPRGGGKCVVEWVPILSTTH